MSRYIDSLIEKAFCDGYYFAQREFIGAREAAEVKANFVKMKKQAAEEKLNNQSGFTRGFRNMFGLNRKLNREASGDFKNVKMGLDDMKKAVESNRRSQDSRYERRDPLAFGQKDRGLLQGRSVRKNPNDLRDVRFRSAAAEASGVHQVAVDSHNRSSKDYKNQTGRYKSWNDFDKGVTPDNFFRKNNERALKADKKNFKLDTLKKKGQTKLRSPYYGVKESSVTRTV